MQKIYLHLHYSYDTKLTFVTLEATHPFIWNQIVVQRTWMCLIHTALLGTLSNQGAESHIKMAEIERKNHSANHMAKFVEIDVVNDR